MSPETPPGGTFGRSARSAAGAALALALLGCAAVAGVERYLTRPGTPLGEAFLGSGIPPALPLLLGMGTVVALACLGFWKSVRTAERFRLAPEGLHVAGPLGAYTLEWSNILEARPISTGALGIRVRSREAVWRTHEGTAEQRGWLRTMEPFGEWDFLYPAVCLGQPAGRVAGWIVPYLDGPRPEVSAAPGAAQSLREEPH